MPLQDANNKSRFFKDISMSFKVNPLNFDLISLQNEQAINRSIRNLVLTNRGEKFFQPLFGSNVYNSLFENIDNLSAVALKDTIVNLITNNEPRVELDPENGVLVKVNSEQNAYDVQINYNIIGMNLPTVELEFSITEPSRY